MKDIEHPVNQHTVHNYQRSPAMPETHAEPRFGHDLSHLRIHADPKKPESTEPAEPKSSSGVHPYTAGALMASSSVEGCKVPAGRHGSAKVVKFRIYDFNGKPVAEDLKVGEKFNPIEDNYNVYPKLVPNSYSSEKGSFDDCYRFYLPDPLPDDFRLVVEQNHLLGNEVISKNRITYTPDNILVSVFPRQPGKRDFGTSSKLY